MGRCGRPSARRGRGRGPPVVGGAAATVAVLAAALVAASAVPLAAALSATANPKHLEKQAERGGSIIALVSPPLLCLV